MIENFQEFVDISKTYYKNYRELNELETEIKDIVSGFEIRCWQKYLFEVRKENREEEMSTQDLARMEEILGCPFDFGGRRYAKFVIDDGDNEKGIAIIKRYKKLVGDQYNLAKKLKEISNTQYPDAVICGKRRRLETFTSSCWGFRIREIDKDLSLADIMAIEKETGSEFSERNTYGCDFRFKLD